MQAKNKKKIFFGYLIILVYLWFMITTESKALIKRKARDKDILDLWNSFYEQGKTQITPLAESIAKKKNVSLSTVKRIVKPYL